VDYISNSPALKSAQARRDFFSSAYQVLRNIAGKQEHSRASSEDFKLFQDFMFTTSNSKDDWRWEIAFGDCELLKKVYKHSYDRR
jgi:hypothetical protein